MKICFIVDFRSPIARSWIEYFIAREYEVHVVSTHETIVPSPGLASLHCLSMGLASLRSRPLLRRHLAISAGTDFPDLGKGRLVAGSFLRRLSTELQHAYKWVAPYETHLHARRLARLIKDINPDLVHAMRIPFEAVLGARALASASMPFLVSVWGNDFTLHARDCGPVARATRFVMTRADAVHTDCERDIRLAEEWGLDARKPRLLVPGNGGIRTDVFHPAGRDEGVAKRWRIPIDAPVVLNARNFRPSYVRNDTFFAAMPAVLKVIPDAIFLCIGMRGNPIAESWVRRFHTSNAVRLLPAMNREEMAELFRLATVAVSPSNHDGTPNTLLEAMACGAFPVAGDIESVREWIESGNNGLLCDPNDVNALAHAIMRALLDRGLRERAAIANQALIAQRARFQDGMRRAAAFYEELVDRATLPARERQPIPMQS